MLYHLFKRAVCERFALRDKKVEQLRDIRINEGAFFSVFVTAILAALNVKAVGEILQYLIIGIRYALYDARVIVRIDFGCEQDR